MSKISDMHYFSLRQAIGEELKRVREEKGLSLEQVTEQTNLNSVKILERIENGRNRFIFLIFRLINFYKKRIKIELVD